jgi:hypothetical protein
MNASGSQRLAALALALTVLAGCNLVLDNEKRSLSRIVEPVGTHDAGSTSGPAADGGEGDAASLDGDVESNTCEGTASAQCPPSKIDMRSEGCGNCGAGTRTRMRGCTIDCRWGSWSPWSECQEPEEVCKPGETQEKMEACGLCGLGMRKTTRSCTSSCGWSDWSPQSCVEDEATCMPGAIMKLADVLCGTMCGRAPRMQTCNTSCAWDPIVMGACGSEGMCKPGDSRMAAAGGCNPSFCNKGVSQQTQTCTQNCAWGAPTPVGTCTIPADVCRPMDLGGMGSRCQPNDTGMRETCMNSTAGATACTWGNRVRDMTCQ